MIYLDYAASSPMSPTAREVYLNVATHYYGNPNSLHDIGSDARQILEASRKTLADLINVRAGEIFFTGGGTEANQQAIRALLSSTGKKTGHLVTNDCEHSSVRYLFDKLEKQGFEVSRIGVNGEGMLDLKELKASLRPDTLVASIQWVNSETGVIQPVKEISRILKEKDVLFHSDAVQAFGKLQLDMSLVDALSVSGHKVYGPKGVGAAYISKRVDWKPDIPGTTQEQGFRGGTQDVAAIAAFAAAAKEIHASMISDQEHYTEMRENLISHIRAKGWEITEEGNTEAMLPHILGLRFPGIEGQFLMLECSQAGLAISTGSACQVGMDQPNRTMLAMGRSEQEAREFVRISLGKGIRSDEIPEIIEKIDAILTRHFKKITS